MSRFRNVLPALLLFSVTGIFAPGPRPSLQAAEVALAPSSGLPALAELTKQFDDARTESDRYNFFDRMGRELTEIVSVSEDARIYIRFFKSLAKRTETLGDAAWVVNRGLGVASGIAERRTLIIADGSSPVPTDEKARRELLELIPEASDGFQHEYLSRRSVAYLMNIRDRQTLRIQYDFVSRLAERVLAVDPSTPDYVQTDLTYLGQLISYFLLSQYKEMSQEEIEPWLYRVSPDGAQKVLYSFQDDIVSATEGDLPLMRKLIWASKLLYTHFHAKYANDPFRDYYYRVPQQTLAAILLKHRRYNWEIRLEDVRFLIQGQQPRAISDFAEALSNSVVDAVNLPVDAAVALLPAFDFIDGVLKEKSIWVNPFIEAYQRVKILGLPRINFEGVFKIDLPERPTLTVAFVSEERLAAGFAGVDDYTNVSFTRIDFDNRQGKYVGQTSVGNKIYLAKLSFAGNRVQGCLNEKCFTGERIDELPDFIGKYKNSAEVRDVTGTYRGKIVYRNGVEQVLTLRVFFFNGTLLADGDSDGEPLKIFDTGLTSENRGFIYLMNLEYRTNSLHFLRAEVDEAGNLSGVRFSTNRGLVASFHLKRID